MSERILLVDREPNRCRLLRKRLERQGFSVTSVGSFEQAAEECELPPGVMVVDVALLCGPERGQIEDLVTRMLGSRTYVCRSCGRVLREAVAGRGRVVCCELPMESIEPVVEPEAAEEASTW